MTDTARPTIPSTARPIIPGAALAWLEALATDACATPWEADGLNVFADQGGFVADFDTVGDDDRKGYDAQREQDRANAVFAVTAVNAIGSLIDEIRALRTVLDQSSAKIMDHIRAEHTGPLIDPDCRDQFKHASCVGGPCECECHATKSDAT